VIDLSKWCYIIFVISEMKKKIYFFAFEFDLNWFSWLLFKKKIENIFLCIYIIILSICVNICIELSSGEPFQKEKNNIKTTKKKKLSSFKSNKYTMRKENLSETEKKEHLIKINNWLYCSIFYDSFNKFIDFMRLLCYYYYSMFPKWEMCSKVKEDQVLDGTEEN